MKKKTLSVIGVLVVLAAVLWIVTTERPENSQLPDNESGKTESVARSPIVPAVRGAATDTDTGTPTSVSEEADDTEREEPKTPEELKEEAEDAAVDSFDALTDKWMEPSEKGVTMEDVSAFVAAFKKVPAGRREECLQRALNLVPDENVMLLAGVLMDKSQPKELVELVFNDILNRDEDVKKPILQQVFKDKTHPCWADTAWILDVTGETPENAKSDR